MSDIFSENTLANWRGNNSFSREALLCGVTEPQYWTGGTEVKKKITPITGLDRPTGFQKDIKTVGT